MNPDCEFYLCPTCFRASDELQSCHGRMMVCYAGYSLNQRKPPMDRNGRINNRAPIWFLEAQARNRLKTS